MTLRRRDGPIRKYGARIGAVDCFSQYALEAEGKAVRLSSMCTVFAESEVVSMIGRGETAAVLFSEFIKHRQSNQRNDKTRGL